MKFANTRISLSQLPLTFKNELAAASPIKTAAALSMVSSVPCPRSITMGANSGAALVSGSQSAARYHIVNPAVIGASQNHSDRHSLSLTRLSTDSAASLLRSIPNSNSAMQRADTIGQACNERPQLTKVGQL